MPLPQKPATGKHVRRSRSHSHKRKTPVSGRKRSTDQRSASGSKERKSAKVQKPASGGKANKHDREKAQKRRKSSKDPKPASGGKESSREKAQKRRKSSKDPKPASGGKAKEKPVSGRTSSTDQKPASGGKERNPERRFRERLERQSPSQAEATLAVCSSPSRARKRSRSPSPDRGQGTTRQGTPAIGCNRVQWKRDMEPEDYKQLLNTGDNVGPEYNLDYMSEVVLKADGLTVASRRNLTKQMSVLGEPDRFLALFQDMPPGELPASGGTAAALKTIKCLLNAHRGELREWHGWWETVDGPLPEKDANPDLWHDQFFPPQEPEGISTIFKPASGGERCVRRAIVLGMADLLFDYGEVHSVRSLYDFYRQLRVFAHKRGNTRPKSQMPSWRSLAAMPASGGRGGGGAGMPASGGRGGRQRSDAAMAAGSSDGGRMLAVGSSDGGLAAGSWPLAATL